MFVSREINLLNFGEKKNELARGHQHITRFEPLSLQTHALKRKSIQARSDCFGHVVTQHSTMSKRSSAWNMEGRPTDREPGVLNIGAKAQSSS